jgi:hypothetical protein
MVYYLMYRRKNPHDILMAPYLNQGGETLFLISEKRQHEPKNCLRSHFIKPFNFPLFWPGRKGFSDLFRAHDVVFPRSKNYFRRLDEDQDLMRIGQISLCDTSSSKPSLLLNKQKSHYLGV